MKRSLAVLFFLAVLASPSWAATCYIAEFPLLAESGVQVARQPTVATQTVTVTGTSAQSAAFSGDTRLVRIHCDAIVSFLFGTNPTATTASPRLAADQTEYFSVPVGAKVAFITNS
jgi:hypothetical protein